MGLTTDRDDPGLPERYKRKLEQKYQQLQVKIAGKLLPGVVVLHVTCAGQS